MNPKIIVTGGTGLLGAYLLRWFKKHGYSQLTATRQSEAHPVPDDLQEGIEWKTLRLPDIIDTFEIIKGQDWVVHSAGFVSYARGDKKKLLEINQEGTRQIVNACLAHDVQHLVYISSIGTLGKEKNFVTLNETSPWLQNEFSTTYGLSKYLGEVEAWRGAGEGLKVSTVLPSVILGTGDWHRSSLQIIDRVANKSGFYPGGQTGYVDVRDVASFVGMLLEKDLNGERWILNSTNLTYGDLYKLIGDSLGIKKQFRLAPKRLAQILLFGRQLFTGTGIGTEVLNHAYGTFTYDGTKSLTVEGFAYRPIQTTIQGVTEIYKKQNSFGVLPFD